MQPLTYRRGIASARVSYRGGATWCDAEFVGSSHGRSHREHMASRRGGRSGGRSVPPPARRDITKLVVISIGYFVRTDSMWTRLEVGIEGPCLKSDGCLDSQMTPLILFAERSITGQSAVTAVDPMPLERQESALRWWDSVHGHCAACCSHINHPDRLP